MSTFGQSFKRELGKNTGKWVSNKVFGSGHATPHRVIIERERAERREAREEARRYKEEQKQLESDRREAEKERKRLEKEMAELERQELIAANTKEVKDHESYLEVIQSVHKDYSKEMDWDYYLNLSPPTEVKPLSEVNNEIETEVQSEINEKISSIEENFKFSIAHSIFKFLYDKPKFVINLIGSPIFLGIIVLLLSLALKLTSISGGVYFIILLIFAAVWYLASMVKSDKKKEAIKEQKIEELREFTPQLINEVLEYHEEEYNAYSQEKSDYDKIQNIAKAISSNSSDNSASEAAIKLFEPFKDLNDYGSGVNFQIKDKVAEITFFAHGDEVIPQNDKSLLRKGAEVKESPMPKTKFNEIYQDYVCSCALRIAREVFNLLPNTQNTHIDVKSTELNDSTGNMEEIIILSVDIDRSSLDNLNFELLDPSNSISNFKHNMKFKKSSGFEKVDSI